MKTYLYHEAFSFYKKLYPNETILFHVANEYVAINHDAHFMADELKLSVRQFGKISLCCFPENQLEGMTFRLVQASISIHIVEYRDDCGNFVLPKVKQILEDIESDY